MVTSEPTTVSNSQTQKEGFAFKFGNAEAPKSNAPTVTTAVQPCFGFPASDISAGSTAQHTAAQDGGGFKFTFGKNKRNADDDNVDNSKKCAMPSAGDTPVAFGSFSAGGNPVVSAAGGVSVGFSSSSPFTAVSTTATATPIFGALSTAASKPTVSSTFSFGNSGNVTSLNATPLPTFGGASQAQATSSSIFGSPFAQPNTPQNPSALAFGASSSSTTTSFGGPANSSLLAFGSQNADAGVTNNTSVPPAFGTSNPARVSPFAPASTNSVFGITPPTFGGFGSLQSGAINPSPAPSLPGPNFTGGFNLSTPPTFQFGRQPQADNGVFTFSGNQVH